jgi:hypothetical protein
MIISVKRKHIKAGVKCSACECPVALALKDAGYNLGRNLGLGLGLLALGVDVEIINTQEASFVTTTRVRKFIRQFDKTGKGKPFNFRLIKA